MITSAAFRNRLPRQFFRAVPDRAALGPVLEFDGRPVTAFLKRRDLEFLDDLLLRVADVLHQ